jgi:hypothetical protein
MVPYRVRGDVVQLIRGSTPPANGLVSFEEVAL